MNSIYDVSIRHVRTDPVRHDVRRNSYLWFADLDDLPRLPKPLRALARFEGRDHMGDAARSIRANVDALLAEHGIDLRGGRVTMLANARSLGYVFNPLSVFWCHDDTGALVCVIAEVHNTYGAAHSYVLRTDDHGHAEADKQLYVSPFYPVDGRYRMRLPEPGDELALTVTLHRPGQAPFVATLRGTRRSASVMAVLRAGLRYPLETYRVRASIARHGLALWRKGLPVQPQSTAEIDMTSADRIAALLRQVAGVELPVRVRTWDGSEAGPAEGPVLQIRSRRALRRLLWAPGELGLARAYVSGDVDVEGDLTDGLSAMWRAGNASGAGRVRVSTAGRLRAAASAVRLGALGSPPAAPSCEARLRGRLHTRARDRAAIAHHYDLSNQFYELLLDETMAYSSAYFAAPGTSLVDAQRAKLDLVCTKLGLHAGMQLLDVGCGWGSLTLHAAERYGAFVTGVTLSEQQRDHVAKQVAERGLADRVTVRLQDYRELATTGELFDAVASIEMGEHVGEAQYPEYAGILHGALRPSGRLLLQQMSRRAGTAPGGGPFIESYIAPDMHMRPLPQTLAHLERAGFEICDVHAMREHYVQTVRLWMRTLDERWPEFVELAGVEVARVWRLYLAGGALSFEQGRMGVDQILAARA